MRYKLNLALPISGETLLLRLKKRRKIGSLRWKGHFLWFEPDSGRQVSSSSSSHWFASRLFKWATQRLAREDAKSKLEVTTATWYYVRCNFHFSLSFSINFKFLPKLFFLKSTVSKFDFLVSMLQKIFPWAANQLCCCCEFDKIVIGRSVQVVRFFFFFFKFRKMFFRRKKIIVVVMFQFVDWSIWFFWCFWFRCCLVKVFLILSCFVEKVIFWWVVCSFRFLLLFWLSFQFLVVVIVVVVKKQSSFFVHLSNQHQASYSDKFGNDSIKRMWGTMGRSRWGMFCL